MTRRKPPAALVLPASLPASVLPGVSPSWGPAVPDRSGRGGGRIARFNEIWALQTETNLPVALRQKELWTVEVVFPSLRSVLEEITESMPEERLSCEARRVVR